MPLAARSDDDLILLARGGVDLAFDTLVRRYQAAVLRVAARYVGTPALAPDVAQNAFLEIYRALPRYQPLGRFNAYLYRVVLNQCRMAYRSARIEAQALGRIADEAAQGTGAEVEGSLGSSGDVDRAVAGLSEKLRSAIMLRYIAELDYAEIAETLDIPVGTAKRRVFDALKVLHDRMVSS